MKSSYRHQLTWLQCSGLTIQEVFRGTSVVVVNVSHVWQMKWLFGVVKLRRESFPQRQYFVILTVQGFPKQRIVTGLLLLLLFL
jgi:hypothetical protein